MTKQRRWNHFAMRRRLFKFLAIATLALLVGTVALWMRGYFVNDWLGRVHYSPGVPSEDHHLYLMLGHGTATFVWGGDPAENFSNVRWQWQQFPPQNARMPYRGDGPAMLHAIGIGWKHERLLSTGETHAEFQLRMASPASLSAIVLIVLALQNRLRRENVEGVCAACRYDLRATPVRCPECGTLDKLENERTTSLRDLACRLKSAGPGAYFRRSF